MRLSLRCVIPISVLCGLTGLVPVAALAADAAAGKAVFDAKCKSCHGADGTGNLAIAKMMKVDLKPLASESDAAIKGAVTMGLGKMKPVTSVAGADLDNLVAYVHTLKK